MMAIQRRAANPMIARLTSRALDAFTPLLALVAAFAVASLLLLAMGASPVAAVGSLFAGAFGSENATAETLVKATPMLLVAIGICIAFKGGITNVGGEGQMILGALAGVTVTLGLPTLIPAISGGWIIVAALLAGFLAGALYGALAGVLKVAFNVNEILSTIMLNAVAVQLMNGLLNGLLLDPAEAGMNNIPKTARILEAAQLPRLSLTLPEGVAAIFQNAGVLESAELFARTRLHTGLLLAAALAIVASFLLWRTTIGFRIRAVGENERAARYGGIPVGRTLVLSIFLAGGLAGLAGVVQVLGLQYRLQTDGSPTGFTANAGFNGIVVALFGGLNPLGAIPASALFGGLLVGAQKMQRDLGIPAALITAFNGLIVLFVVSSAYFTTWRQKRRARRQSHPPPTAAPAVENLPVPSGRSPQTLPAANRS